MTRAVCVMTIDKVSYLLVVMILTTCASLQHVLVLIQYCQQVLVTDVTESMVTLNCMIFCCNQLDATFFKLTDFKLLCHKQPL